MKVLLVAESLGSGGAERQLVGLAVGLKNKGYEIFVLTYYNENFYKIILDNNKIYNEVYDKALSRIPRLWYLNKKVNQFAPDVTISFLPGPNVALGFGKIVGFLKSKLIVSERNYTWHWGIKERIYMYFYRRADAIITNSKAECDNIKQNFFSLSPKVACIVNFVDYEKFLPDTKKHYGKFKVLTVARIRDYKNVHGLINVALGLVNKGLDIHFDWYGNDYNDKYSDYVKQMIKNYNLSDRFIFHNPVSDISAIYPQYDLFCLPSFKEGYPNVILEAMSCQLPVICSRICENGSIIVEGKGGFLFDPNNNEEIENCINRMYNLSCDDREQMGLYNRKRIIENNSIKIFINKYIDLINHI